MSALSVVSTLEAQPCFASAPKTNHQPIKPLFMWAGGKTKLLKHYKGKMPSYSGFTSYIEPFFGGGAVFCDVVNSTEIQQFAINDVNPEIVSIYRAIKTDTEAFIAQCIVLADERNAKPSAERKTWYYGLRKQYWDMEPSSLTAAATLYVLMKTGFNGLWQPSVENAGKFGTAAGLLDKEAKINPDLIRAWSAKLKNTTITCNDYRNIQIPKNPCLIYCDPPYRGSFTSYGQAFDDQAQTDLVEWCRSLSAQGHTVVLANRDCDDGFFDEVLADATAIHHFDVTYTVGRKKKTDDGYEAKKAKEFVAIFEGQAIQAANEDDFQEASINLDAPEIRAEKLSSDKYRDIFLVLLPHSIQRISDRPIRRMSPIRPRDISKEVPIKGLAHLANPHCYSVVCQKNGLNLGFPKWNTHEILTKIKTTQGEAL